MELPDGLERCERCGTVGQDRRTLWMACFYAMDELGIPFTQVGLLGIVLEPTGEIGQYGMPVYKTPHPDWHEKADRRVMFSLRVCKGCRGDWLSAIKTWFRKVPDADCRYNSDASTYGLKDDLPALVAEAERLNGAVAELAQRIEAARDIARDEMDRREATDKR
jgi:hypothetical protein